MNDVAAIKGAIMGIIPDNYNEQAADVNKDGDVNVADIVMLLRLFILQ